MPSVSDKQQRAMAAAAHGNSTIGIPAKVGKEYMMADSLRRGNSTKNGIHTTHWKTSASNQGGASVGGGT